MGAMRRACCRDADIVRLLRVAIYLMMYADNE